MISPRWGAIVASAVAGCSPRATPEPVTPVTPTTSAPPPVTSAAAPVPTAPTVGRFVPLFGVRVADEPVRVTSEIAVATDDGVFRARKLLDTDSFFETCPVKGLGEDCVELTFAPWDGPSHGATKPVTVRVAGHAWSALFAGKHAAYGMRWTAGEGVGVDRIGPDGQIEQVMHPALDSDDSIAVVETSAGVRAVGSSGPTLSLYGPPDAETPLPIAHIASWGTAMDARRLHQEDKAHPVAWGRPGVLATEDGIDVLWIEVRPPPPGVNKAKYVPPPPEPTPARGADKTPPPPKQERWLRQRGNDGCGGSNSRPLADDSVKKRLHVTTFSLDGKKKRDREIPMAAGLDGSTLDVVRTAGGVQIGRTTYDVHWKKLADGAPSLRPAPVRASAPPIEELVAADFDEAAGEGIALVQQGTRRFVRRFDRDGKPLGEVVETHAALAHPFNSPALAHAEGGWVAGLGDAWNHGPGVVVLDGTDTEIRWASNCDVSGDCEAPYDWAGGARVIRGWEKDAKAYRIDVAARKLVPVEGDAPVLGTYVGAGTMPSGPMLLGAKRQAVMRNGTFEAFPDEFARNDVFYGTHRVWDDVVWFASRKDASLVAYWIRANVTIAIEQKVPYGEDAEPMLGGRWLVPSKPGPLVDLTSLVPEDGPFQPELCSSVFATGPTSYVLVCTDVTGETAPATRVGLRTVVLPP